MDVGANIHDDIIGSCVLGFIHVSTYCVVLVCGAKGIPGDEAKLQVAKVGRFFAEKSKNENECNITRYIVHWPNCYNYSTRTK